MKKLFTFLLAVVSVLTVSAQSEKVLYEDNDATMLNWGVACQATAADVEGIKAGDIIEVTVTAVDAKESWPKFGFEGLVGDAIYPDVFEMWTRRDNLPYTGKYIITEDVVDRFKNGFELKGNAVTITKVVLIENEAEELPEGQTVLFDNPDASMLSWSVACTATAKQLEGIKAGDIIEVTVTAVDAKEDWPKFGFEGIVGESIYPDVFEMWTRRDNLPYTGKYVITEDVVDRFKNGFELKGNAVTITKVVLIKTVAEEIPEGQSVLFNNPDAPMLSWSVLCTVTAEQLEGIKAGDIIEATVTAVDAKEDWPKFGFEGIVGDAIYPEAYEMWTRRDNLPYTAKYIITEDVVDRIKGGFELKGNGVTVTKVVLIKTVSEELPEGQTLIFNNPDAPMLSWSVLCSVTAAQVKGIKAGDYFIATVNACKEGCEWPKFGFEANGKDNYPEAFQMWGDKTFPYEATYYVTADDVELLKNGFDIKGDGVQITRVVFVAQSGEADAEIVLWKGEPTLMTWGAGPTVPAGKAATIEANDKLVITIDEIVGGEGKWPKVVCRSEDGWDEIFSIELFGDKYANVELPLVEEVTVTEEMLELLKAGFNFGGEAAYISKVALVKNSGESGIEDVIVGETPAVVSVYSISGVCVRHNVDAASATDNLPAGLYIVGGKKVLVK